jgi:cell division protein FtsA
MAVQWREGSKHYWRITVSMQRFSAPHIIMTRRIITGIDIGTSTIRVVVSEYTGQEVFPRIIGMGSADAKGLRHGYVVHRDEATRSIQKALHHAEQVSGVRIDEVFIAFGGTGLEGTLSTGTIIVPRADTEIMDGDVERAQQMAEQSLPFPANKRILHAIPVEYRIDGKEVLGRPVGMRGLKLEAKMLIVTALAQHLDDLTHVVEDAGVIVADVMAAPIAASFVTLTRAQQMAGCVLANIGAETLSVVVYEGGVAISLEVFPVGSTNITNDIALGLKIPLEEAERVKLGKSTAPIQKKRHEDIIEGRLVELFGLVNTHLKNIGKQELLPAGVILIGGGAEAIGIEETAKGALKLPARIPNPDFMVDPETALPVRSPSWFVAYGLTIFGANAEGGGFRGSGAGFTGFKKTLGNIFRQLLP